VDDEILRLVAERQTADRGVAAGDIAALVRASRPTLNRALARLVQERRLFREGGGRSTRYRLTAPLAPASMPTGVLTFTPAAQRLHAALSAPLASRAPVGYVRDFVDTYVPNETWLLPKPVAERLYRDGRAEGQQPAGTYARKVLEQLLIDLSWHSSRLEGNRLTLLDTRELFARGRGADDVDATMLLNHKDAIEFMVDAVPEEGITVPVVRNLHSILMQGLLADAAAVGAIRTRIVNVEHSVYLPSNVKSVLQEMLERIVAKARAIKNPVEAAFFLWVQIAYLQPFEDGNKRTSRLSANLPLFLSNCAPLSFLDVSIGDYAYAMLGVYERNDTAIAAELFEWTYRRSIDKYRVVRESLGAPDPLRARYRIQLAEVVRGVVAGAPPASVLAADAIAPEDRAAFYALVREELQILQPFNCGRFRLASGPVERWIQAGRPGAQ
jgi:Fic family protein